jgi:hypothetical protein
VALPTTVGTPRPPLPLPIVDLVVEVLQALDPDYPTQVWFQEVVDSEATLAATPVDGPLEEEGLEGGRLEVVATAAPLADDNV